MVSKPGSTLPNIRVGQGKDETDSEWRDEERKSGAGIILLTRGSDCRQDVKWKEAKAEKEWERAQWLKMVQIEERRIYMTYICMPIWQLLDRFTSAVPFWGSAGARGSQAFLAHSRVVLLLINVLCMTYSQCYTFLFSFTIVLFISSSSFLFSD